MFLLPTDLSTIWSELRKKVERLQLIVNHIANATIITSEDVERMYRRLQDMVTQLFQYVYQTPYNILTDEQALELVKDLTDFVWMRGFTPIGDEIMWNAWYESKLGILVRGVIARYKIHTKKPLNAKELAILAGTSVANICILLRRKRIKGERRQLENRGGYEWFIPPDEAAEYLSREDHKVTPPGSEDTPPPVANQQVGSSS